MMEENKRELFLKTLMIGDKVRVVPLLGESYITKIQLINTFHIYTADGGRFERHSGKYKYTTTACYHFDKSARIEPVEPI